MILEIIAVVLIVIFGIIAAVLLIPFHVIFSTSLSLRARSGDIALSLLGLRLWRMDLFQPKKRKEKKEKKKAEEKKKEEEREFGIRRLVRMLSLFRESLPAFAVLARSVRKAIRLNRLDMDFAVGLDDPVETAILSGYVSSFAWILNSIPAVSFSFQPEFETLRLEGSIKAEARVRMLRVVIGFLQAYSKKPFRRFIKEVRSR